MRLFKGRDEQTYDKVRRRLSRVGVEQRLAWAYSTLWSTQAYLDEYGRSKSQDALGEARRGAVSLLAAIDSALDRDR